MIDALNNRMLFGALSNLRLAPHVREGRLGAATGAGEAPPAVSGAKASRPPVAAPALDGKNHLASRPTTGPTSAIPTEERLSLSPAALAALRDENAAGPAIASFEAESYGRTGTRGVESSVLPLSSADPTAAAAAMALAARAYGDDYRAAGPGSNPSSAATAGASTAPARLSSLGALRA